MSDTKTKPFPLQFGQTQDSFPGVAGDLDHVAFKGEEPSLERSSYPAEADDQDAVVRQ